MTQHNEQRRKFRWSNKQLILITVVSVAVVMAFFGGVEDGVWDWRGFFSNLSTELLGAVITYWILDRFITSNEEEQSLKERLIREMENRDSGITKRAVTELRAKGWLQDGSLNGWFLQDTNLKNVRLKHANLEGFGLYRSDLTGTQISEAQMLTMTDLRLSTLDDGTTYDGRYCLMGDLSWAREKYGIEAKTASLEEMAEYYGVSVEAYRSGQEWALAYIPDRVPNKRILEDQTGGE